MVLDSACIGTSLGRCIPHRVLPAILEAPELFFESITFDLAKLTPLLAIKSADRISANFLPFVFI
ncbi:MAG: hypothetical protein ACD_21C00050G0001 [uncultured bacterium]|nr:MAG: hypothetical protein ACD_21C00050G0001 [uncultured bacterium]